MKARLKPIPTEARGTIAARPFSGLKFPSGWHFHPETELTCVLECSGRRWIGDHVGDFGPGDLVLLGSNLPHFWANDPPPRPRGKARCIVVQFREDHFGESFWRLPELQPVVELLQRSARGLHFTGEVRDRMIRGMEKMVRLPGLKRLSLLLDLLGELAAAEGQPLSSPDFRIEADPEHIDRVRYITDYIARHYSQGFSHAELAEELGMSVSGLSHYFKRAVGDTLSNHVAELRVGQACRRLLLTDENVSDIALACGFESLSSFNARFKKLRGVSPREFRKLRGCG